MEFRVAGPGDERLLAELFSHIDETFFRPHPFTAEEAHRIANLSGLDLYALLVDGERPLAYGMLRGWDEGFAIPALGIAVRTDAQGRGLGRLMMAHLHHAARTRGAGEIRLRVHADNVRARKLYESLGYAYRGEERGELVMALHLGTRRRHPSAPGARGPVAGTTVDVRLLRADDPAWDEWLRDVRRDFYHTAGYHAYARGSGQGEPCLVVVGDRQRGMAWPYLLRRVAEVEELAGSDATDVNSVYGYPGPLAWGCEPGDPFVERAWSEILETWRQQGAVSAFTRFHPLLGNSALVSGLGSLADAGDPSVGVVPAGPTVSVDLSIGDEAVRGSYGRDLRREIDASRRAGLTTVHDEDWAYLPTFTRLYQETMVRAGATGYYFFDEGDFRRLRAALAGNLHLLVTRSEDAVASAGLFTEFEGIVEWYLVGSSATFRSLSPSKVLVDDAIRWARGRGNAVLHMGGGRGGREDTLLWFKGRFSPRRHPFHTGRWILDPEAYQELVRARLAGVAGRGAPDPRFFPAYRAPFRRDE